MRSSHGTQVTAEAASRTASPLAKKGARSWGPRGEEPAFRIKERKKPFCVPTPSPQLSEHGSEEKVVLWLSAHFWGGNRFRGTRTA